MNQDIKLHDQDTVTASSSNKPPWNPYDFFWLALLFSFGASGILAGLNWRRLGKPQQTRPTVFLSIAGILALSGALVFLPASNIPARPLAYVVNIAIAVFLIVLQMPAYKQWVADHGRPTRKETGFLIPLVVGVSTTVTIVLFVFLIAFAAAPLLPVNRAVTHYSQGVGYGNHNQLDLAIQEYTRAIALDPQLSQAYSNRGNTYLLLGNFDQAITDCDEAIALRPDDGVAYFTRGIAYSTRGQANDALSDLTKAIELHTNEAQAYYYRSFVYVQLGKQEAAVQDLHNALELNPYLELRRDIETALEELNS